MRRTVENIKDPLFRFFEREVNAGISLLSQVRKDMEEVMLICQGEKKPTNHHRTLISELAKGKNI
jgi:dynein heavy chain 1